MTYKALHSPAPSLSLVSPLITSNHRHTAMLLSRGFCSCCALPVEQCPAPPPHSPSSSPAWFLVFWNSGTPEPSISWVLQAFRVCPTAHGALALPLRSPSCGTAPVWTVSPGRTGTSPVPSVLQVLHLAQCLVQGRAEVVGRLNTWPRNEWIMCTRHRHGKRKREGNRNVETTHYAP